MSPVTHQTVLERYREGLASVLGNELNQVILYGSHARGEARLYSDIDILCVMRAPFDYGDLMARTSELTAALSLENDVVLSRAFATEADFASRQLPFLMNVRREGIAV